MGNETPFWFTIEYRVKKFKMNSKKLLDLGSRTVQHLQKRGRAVQNWKRPTMDEYPVPTESWSVVKARTDRKYNGILAGGLIFFGLTSVFCWFDDRTVFYTVPRHLIDLKNDRLLENFEPEEK